MALDYHAIHTQSASKVNRRKNKTEATKSIGNLGVKSDNAIRVGDRNLTWTRLLGFLFISGVWRMVWVVDVAVALVVALVLAPIYLSLYLICYLSSVATSLVARSKSMSLLTAVDAMSGQDTTTCNAVISVLTFMDGEVRREDMRDAMMRRVVLARDDQTGQLRFPVFSRRVDMLGDYLVWRDDPDFMVDDHVIYYGSGVDQQPPATEQRLKEIVQEIYNWPMDCKRSGWQIVIVPLGGGLMKFTTDGLNISTTRSATCVVWRFHHAIADGVALTRLVMEHIAENSDDFKEAFAAVLARLRSKRPSWSVQIAQTVALNAYAALMAPFLLVKQFTYADTNLLHGPKLSGKKLVEWSRPVDLQTVKDIKNATKTTVNDVILSCLGGALARYYLKHKAEVPVYVTTAIPVTMQVADQELMINNKFSFILAKLPTLNEADALDRLMQTKAVIESVKNSPEILVNFWLICIMFNVIPNTLTKWLMNNKKSVTLTASNVPGPNTAVKVCGRTITQVVPFLPHRGRMGLTVSIFSYVGQIRMGIVADSALMKTKDDVHCLIDGFNEEMMALQSICGLN